MVVNHIDHHLHPVLMDRFAQFPEFLHRAVFRIHGPVIPVGVRTSQAALFAFHADRMNGHEPDDVGPQSADTVQIGNNGIECTFRSVRTHIN